VLVGAADAIGWQPPSDLTGSTGFAAWVLGKFPGRTVDGTAEQLVWLDRAVKDARADRLGAVAQCLERVRTLAMIESEVAPPR
jgi:hypothetical protein